MGDDGEIFYGPSDSPTYYGEHPETAGSSAREDCRYRMTCGWFDDNNHLSCPRGCSEYERE